MRCGSVEMHHCLSFLDSHQQKEEKLLGLVKPIETMTIDEQKMRFNAFVHVRLQTSNSWLPYGMPELSV